MGARRKARESALQMLFQFDVTRPPVDELLRTFWQELAEARQELAEDEPETPKPTPKEIQEFANKIVIGAIAHLAELDEMIIKRAEHWRLERMAIVDRNLLRMALYEFLYEEETPKTVVINEALEIARRFSTFEATQFINGVLDSIKRDLEQEPPAEIS